MKKASYILLVVLLALFFGYVEGNAQEERLECISAPAANLLFSLFQPSDPEVSERGISTESLNYANTQTPTELGPSDVDPTSQISVYRSGGSSDAFITSIEYKNDNPLFETVPFQTIQSLPSTTLLYYPLIL